MKSIRNENLFCLCILGFLFFDLGNVDAIRQGTEGFYLLISKEMYLNDSLLTPMIYNAPHWSKPPLQFWLPMPLYYIFGSSFLLLARLSILSLGLACAFLISRWYENELKRNWIEAFFFLTTPLYFIKYSRIFMMEIPLTYLSVLGSLYFYSYLIRPDKKYFLPSVLLTGLSVLIKGPVSLMMIFPACFIFSLRFRKKGIEKFMIFSLSSFLIASIWFALSYLKYGQEFIDYFFIRENLGKFASKSYPARSVFQGLLIYSFPVNLFALFLIKKENRVKLNPALIFIVLNFLFFFFLWLIPKQKSHHYAVPSIPFLSLFICYSLFSLKDYFRKKAFIFFDVFHNFLIALGLIIISTLFYFQSYLSFTDSKLYLTGALACIALWSFLRRGPINKAYLMSFLIPYILLWQFILPLAFLPIVPDSIVKIVNTQKSSQLFVGYRKPFFIFEATDKEGLIISSRGLADPRIKQGDHVFLSQDRLGDQNPQILGFELLSQWYSWRRGVGFKEAYKAISTRNLRLIQSKYRLFKKL